MKFSILRTLFFSFIVIAGYIIFTTFAVMAAPPSISPGVSSGVSPDMSVGSVHQSKGETFARSGATKVTYTKNAGDMVGAGEILSTGKNSSMTVQFMDSTIMTLGSEAEVEVDELVFDPQGKPSDNHIVISLAQGTYYYVSGHIKKENVTILTPTATIGIRGTELAIKIDHDGATSVGVVKGAAIMKARRWGSDRDNDNRRGVYIDLGSTGRIENNGEISKPFGGVDLTGDYEIDSKIPGVAEWLDHEKLEDEELASNEHNIEPGDDDENYNLRGENYDDENHSTKHEEEDSDKNYDVAENESSHSKNSDESEDDGDEGDDGGDEGDDGGDDDGDDGDDGGDDGDDGGDDGDDGDDSDGDDGDDDDGDDDGDHKDS